MATLALYTVDVGVANQRAFTGNPAAVCLVATDLRLTREQMSLVAEEVNLSDTAFVQPLFRSDELAYQDGRTEYTRATHFGLRWFTPKLEVRLCGHATLAAAHVLFNELHNPATELVFVTLSGQLVVTREAVPDGTRLTLRLPADLPHVLFNARPQPSSLLTPPEAKPLAAAKADRLRQLAEGIVATVPVPPTVRTIAYSRRFHNLIIRISGGRAALQDFQPVFDAAVMALGYECKLTGVAVTASVNPAQGIYDVAVRYFAPWAGIPEDPITGSAYTALAPFWSQHLNRPHLTALQGGRRQGVMYTRVDTADPSHVYISGATTTVIAGTLRL
ncbi:hypothetical protein H4R35_000202 [Dimargaris xerosporica]|nr:hypothetical protein H4R35_000202 [Dimargaris xerosporica]